MAVERNTRPSQVNKDNSPGSGNREKKVGAVIIGGTFQALGLVRSLGKQGIPVYVLDNKENIARYSRYKKKYLTCPDVHKESIFVKFLLDLAQKDNLNGWVIYPNNDETVYLLAKYKEHLEKFYRVTTPPWDIVKFAYDKMLTYQLVEKAGIAVPATYYPRSIEEVAQLDVRFPAILKPSIKEPFYSKTHKKAIRVENKEQLIDEYTRMVPKIEPSQTLMVQELIPGRTEGLYSVGSLCRDGELLAHVVVRRPRQHPMDFGHATTYALTVDVPQLVEMTRKVLKLVRYSGLSEIEFMLDSRDGRYKLIEINPRPWGWHTIAIGAGVDLPYLSYLDMLGEKVKQDGFRVGVKWIRIITDVPTVAAEFLRGKLSISEYINSLRGKKEFAVFSFTDALPFIMEFFLLPLALKKRGVKLEKVPRKTALPKYGTSLREEESKALPCKIIDPTIDSRWDKFVDADEHGTVFHTSNWAKVIKEAYGYMPRYYVLENNGIQMRAGIPFFLIRSNLTGRRLVCLPFSDYCWPLGKNKSDTTTLWNVAVNRVKTGGVSYVESRGWADGFPEAQNDLVLYNYYTRFELNLEPGIEALNKNLHDSVRRGIRQADKRDITVRLSNSEEDMERFYQLNVATRKKLGVLPQPRSFFESIYRNIISRNLGFIGIAEYQGQIVAGVIFLAHGDRIYYKYNASDEKYLQKRPNHMIIWEAIKYACANNYRYFDFGRCTPEEEGLRTFKTRWGAKEFALPYYFYPRVKGFINVKESSLRYRAMQIFSHIMPRWVYVSVGSFLYKHLG
jgi:predicted ATP-grasp superfamily ATP-dependent carboligase/CelD/BcsL family acetyltransferase involved in cellulose biosynthesis